MEMVKRRAARFVLDRYRCTSCVDSLPEDLKWTSPVERRSAVSFVILYKKHNGQVSVDMPPSLTPKNQSTTRVKNSNAYHITGSNNKYNCMAFFQRTAREWNHLREDIFISISPDSGQLGYLTGTPLMYKCRGVAMV